MASGIELAECCTSNLRQNISEGYDIALSERRQSHGQRKAQDQGVSYPIITLTRHEDSTCIP